MGLRPGAERRYQEAKVAGLTRAIETAPPVQLQPRLEPPPKPLSSEQQTKLQEAREWDAKRRFAPDSIVFNLKPLKLLVGKKTRAVAAESELTLVRKNANETVHVQFNGSEGDVPADDLTNDRDWLAAYRTLHRDDG